MVLDALFGVGPRRRRALAVHIGRLYRRSYHHTERLFKSRRALKLRSRCSMPFFGVKPPPLLCSRRPHRTFVPLSPSCKAIVQVETRSMRSWFSMPSLASDRRRRCALAVHIGRLYRSRLRAGRSRESTRARCALTDSMPYPTSDGTRHLRSALTFLCGATAMAFCQASAEVIKDVGRWNSDAYLRYIRECRGEHMSYMTCICSADVDDMEADHLDLDSHDLDDSGTTFNSYFSLGVQAPTQLRRTRAPPLAERS